MLACFDIISWMIISLDKTISSRQATIWGAVFCAPFAFALTIAVTHFKPFINLIEATGRATTFGLVLFYIGLIGLPLAFLVNLAAMLNIRMAFSKWSVEGKVSFHPKPINLIIGAVGFLVALIFGGHLVIDAIACHFGNIPACD